MRLRRIDSDTGFDEVDQHLLDRGQIGPTGTGGHGLDVAATGRRRRRLLVGRGVGDIAGRRGSIARR